ITGGLLPLSFLSNIVNDARRRHTEGQRRVEHLYRVVMGQDGTRHLIHPRQQGSAVQVSTAGDGGPRVIAELHTHGDMAAYWSPTDDADEVGFRFYGVLGRVGWERPEMRLRVGIYGYFWEVPIGRLFEVSSPALGEPLVRRAKRDQIAG
ncbi:MAG: Mov34/MPN/PAD-1 family protein, partial [Ardenticatenales bacterium]|nr:Mov34/MPN/PAD-1 family protein [Ardenticatenales bacterium]